MLLHNQSVNQIEFVKRGSIKSEVLLPFHCVLAAMLSYRPTCVRWTAQEAGDRWQIRGFRADKLCREQREKVSSRLGGTVKKAVHLIFGGISLHAHKPSPCPFIYVWSDSSSIKSIKLHSSIFFFSFPVSLSLLNLFPIFTRWLATAAFHFLSSHRFSLSLNVCVSHTNYLLFGEVTTEAWQFMLCLQKWVWNENVLGLFSSSLFAAAENTCLESQFCTHTGCVFAELRHAK